MERMLCDFLKDRPASCIRVKVAEIDSDGNVVRDIEQIEGPLRSMS